MSELSNLEKVEEMLDGMMVGATMFYCILVLFTSVTPPIVLVQVLFAIVLLDVGVMALIKTNNE